MFAATPLEYRFRYALHGLFYTLGFIPLWQSWLRLPAQTVWGVGISSLMLHRWLGVEAASYSLLGLAILFTGLGAWLRLWGSAYVGASIVKSPAMHGDALLADGPYRRTRNPLYLGTFLHTLGLVLLMQPAGAILCVVGIGVLQVRLALAEEPFLTQRFGEAYLAYKKRVPRFLPALTPRVPPAGTTPNWRMALAGEIYMVGVFVTFLCLGWTFNATPLIQGVLVSLGVSLVLRALLPRVGAPETEAV